MRDNNISVVLSIDKNYIQHCAAAINSIMNSYNGYSYIDFYIVTNDLNDRDKNALYSLSKERMLVHFLDIDPELTKDMPLGEGTISNEITVTTYFRLFLPLLLPKEVHKVLYIDADTITMASLDELWKTDITNYAIAAVPDKDSLQSYHKDRLEIPMNSFYYNAGVMLINLDYLRSVGFTQHALAYIADFREKILYHDQDVINALLYDSILPISYKWNMMDCYLFKAPLCNEKSYNEVIQWQKKPGIVHFAGFYKPWHKECLNPYNYMYKNSLNNTQWAFFKKTFKEKSIFKIIKYYTKIIIKGNPYFKF